MEAKSKFISYSQNFLISRKLVAALVKKSNISSVDVVIEIGSGKGIITESLSKVAGRVIAYEIDGKVAKKLKNRLGNVLNVEIRVADFLEADLPTDSYKVFSNIPFNHTSRIMKKLYFSDYLSPDNCFLILQKEVYYKYFGVIKETQVSLLLKPFYDLKLEYRFNRTDFSPIPSVDPVLVSMTKKVESLIPLDEVSDYRDFVVYVTECWRPSIKLVLKKVFTYPQIKRLSQDLKFKLHRSPADLNFKDWLGIYYFYSRTNLGINKNIVMGSYQKHLDMESTLSKVFRTSSVL